MGALFGLGSAVFWSFANLTIQGSARRFGTLGAVLWAHAVGAAVALVGALVFEGSVPARETIPGAALATAVVASLLAYGGLFDALRHGRLAVVAPIVSAWSLVSVVIGITAFGERPSLLTCLGIALVLVGNLTLARYEGRVPDENGAPGSRRGLWSAVASAVGFGIFAPSVKLVSESTGALWSTTLVWGVELVVALPLLAVIGRLPRRGAAADLVRFAVPPGIFEALGLISLSLGLAAHEITEVSPTSSLSTAFSVLLGVLILRERLGGHALLGAAAASLGVVFVGIGSA